METPHPHGRSELSRRRFNTYDALKILALVAMTVDHAVMYLMPEQEMLHLIGRLAAPIFCFLIGWNLQYRFRGALLVAAILASVTDVVFDGAVLPLNILWAILFGRMLLQWMERRGVAWHPIVLIVTCAIWLYPSLYVVEYGSMVLLWMLWGRAQHLGGRDSVIYAVSGGAAAGALSLLHVTVTPVTFALLAVLTLLVIIMLQRFRLKNLAVPGATLLQFWSRQALGYYVLHRAVLVAIALVWF